MKREQTLGFAIGWLATLLSVSVAHAHAGEEHTDPLSALLHAAQTPILLVAVLLLGIALAAWFRQRRSDNSERESETRQSSERTY